MKKKVVVGMSGGVDSSVAAYLLKEQGYEVIGVTMQIWQEQDVFTNSAEGGCCGLSAVDDARRVAEILGIPYYVMNFREDFQRHVIDYFVDEYLRGHTPNPCIACNRYVKWESLLHRSMEIGAEYIATGHYARIIKLPNGRWTVQHSATKQKDQTYVLYNLTQEQLKRTLMPIGDYEKEQVRELAERAGLPIAHKHDSQDICFVPDHDYAAFIVEELGRRASKEKTSLADNSDNFVDEMSIPNKPGNFVDEKSIPDEPGNFVDEKSIPDEPGNFVDEEGSVLGRHRGIIHYTIGQRKGLGITAETPLFVKEIRPQENEVVICKSEGLFSNVCVVENVSYMSRTEIKSGTAATGKLRYSHAGATCHLYPLPGNRIECHFDKPQRAITPGQAAVFYEDEHILCGGTIVQSIPARTIL